MKISIVKWCKVAVLKPQQLRNALINMESGEFIPESDYNEKLNP